MAATAVQQAWAMAQEQYNWSMSHADTRVADWPLMASPVPTLVLAGSYLIMVKQGPVLMQDRKPFEFRRFLVIYNLAVMMLNLYIGVELAVVSYHLGYSWFCQPVDYSNKPYQVRMAAALWWYYISKLVEFCDTLFFIMRKKNNQLTFLHVYHHSTMFTLWWIGVKFVAGGSSFLAAMMNSYVHVIMYLYYGLSALGPRVQRYLWWKKHITCIQLVQFSSAGVLGIRALIVGCDFPLWMQYALVAYMLSFIVLFGQFYIQSYQKKTKGHLMNGVRKSAANGVPTSSGIRKSNGKVMTNHKRDSDDESEQQQQHDAHRRSANGIHTRAQARRDNRPRRDM
ncbi:ELO family [Trinorchestia longiramus]|nr:ELO family [Trinorchestia longiramus]